jgi:hypothetical protein
VDLRALRRLIGLTLGIVTATSATYLVPGLATLRPWVPGDGYVPFWNIVGRELLGEGEALSAEADEMSRLAAHAFGRPPVAKTSPKSRPTEADAGAHAEAHPESPSPEEPRAVFPPIVPSVEAPTQPLANAEAIDAYYRKLTLVELGVRGAIARTGHWGDSVLGVDGITAGIRRRLQGRFGDAGHGYHLMDRYNPSYRQQGVDFVPGGGWNRCLIVQQCRKKDGHYGYGGLTVDSGGGAASTWGTTAEGFGSIVSRFELWFAHQSEGGAFEIRVDGGEAVRVETRGPHLTDGWHEVRVPPGQHRFLVRAAGGGNVRGYGVVLENDGPGVVWDGMAHIGGSTRGLRTQDAEHIKSQIRRRDLDLMVFMYGGNDMERGYVDLRESMDPYYEEFGEVIDKFRAGKGAHGRQELAGAQ